MDTIKRNAVNIENGRRVWRDSNGTPRLVLGEVVLTIHKEVDVSQSAGQTASWHETIIAHPGRYEALLLAPILDYWTPTAYVQVPGTVKDRHTPIGFGGYYGYGDPGVSDVGKPGWATFAVVVQDGAVAGIRPSAPYGAYHLPEDVVTATFTPEDRTEETD